MKLTKYGHACIVLEEQGRRLVIDPGNFTASFGPADNVAAVVVTHVHADHFDPGHLRKIMDASPGVQIFTTKEVAGQFQRPNTAVARGGDRFEAGPFRLEFNGQHHAVIHPGWPFPQNIGVRVNDKFYYPGDSLTLPQGDVETLAVPANAPWLKVSEAMDFIAQIKPRLCIPTHNGLLAEAGLATYNRWLNEMCQREGIELNYLKPGESIDI